MIALSEVRETEEEHELLSRQPSVVLGGVRVTEENSDEEEKKYPDDLFGMTKEEAQPDE